MLNAINVEAFKIFNSIYCTFPRYSNNKCMHAKNVQIFSDSESTVELINQLNYVKESMVLV